MLVIVSSPLFVQRMSSTLQIISSGKYGMNMDSEFENSHSEGRDKKCQSQVNLFKSFLDKTNMNVVVILKS